MALHEPVKFLLVDDIEENLLALEALLRRDGLDLVKARSGTEALELLLVHDFALALLDVQMPGIDGFELAELMRGTERTRRVPIIFITAVATDERRRFRGYEAGAVDYLLKPVDPQMLRNKAEVFFELACQRQELAQQRDELRAGAERLGAALRRLQAHGDNSPLAMVEFDADLRLIGWSKGAERIFGWNAREFLGKRVTDLRWLHEDDAATFADLSAELLNGKQSRGVHVSRCYRKDGAVIECEWYNSALHDGTGKLVSVNAQILDITERKRAEETQRLLIGELNHRVKNTLATVQAIATQTLRHSKNPAGFADNFSGRIQALARAHSLLSEATWQGAKLAELIQDQLRLGTIDEARLTASGPEVRLPPQLALHVALILHELGTNANKYGALSAATGRIAVNWTVEDGVLSLSWAENGGPPVKAPTKRGFGTTLIEQSVKGEGGSAHASFRADGITWEITLPLPAAAAFEIRRPAPASGPAGASVQADLPAEEKPGRIAGRRFLIVEDEPLVGLELASILEGAGAEVVGPAGTAEQALGMIEAEVIDGALVDGNLHGRPVDDIAAALTRHKVPFLFVSGYGRENLPRAFSSATVVSKPFTHHELVEAAAQLLLPTGDVVKLRTKK
jgi:PAS domain S-box-containing protein